MEELGDGLKVAQQVRWLVWGQLQPPSCRTAQGQRAAGCAALARRCLWRRSRALQPLRVCIIIFTHPPTPQHQLTVTCNRLYAETTQRLEGALAAACGDFRPAHYTRVLEGYMFLGNLGQVRGVQGVIIIAAGGAGGLVLDG